MFGLGVSKLHFADGSVESLPRSGVTVIVGPNNAGKSVLLAEINQMIVDGHISQPRWLDAVELSRDGDQEDFAEWFHDIARIIPVGVPSAGQLALWDGQQGPAQTLTYNQAASAWASGRGLGWVLASYLIGYFDAGSRVSISLGAGPRDPMVPATHPIHQMWDDRELEKRISRLAKRAFGFSLSINRYAQQIQLLIGDVGDRTEPLPPSRDLLDAYAALEPVSSQGDGVKSFIGLLLMSVISDRFVTMIDEPEAFLHPPQAKLLGRYLSEETPSTGQVIIATHSSHVVEGLIDGALNRDVKVIRVSPSGDTGRRKRNVLPADRVGNLWRDPLLRFSNMLDGLFHKGVIVCESDGDCRFYAAALDVHLKKHVEHDLLLTHVGGKARLPQALRELRAFELPVAVIADLDALNNVDYMRDLIVAAQVDDPGPILDDLRAVHGHILTRVAGPTVQLLRETVSPILRRRHSSVITDAEREAVRDAVKVRSGWGEVKRSGLGSFEGDAFATISRVLHSLTQLGIFLVPVGELERWYPDVNAGHGPTFVTSVLESRRYERPTAALGEFLDGISHYFDIKVQSDG